MGENMENIKFIPPFFLPSLGCRPTPLKMESEKSEMFFEVELQSFADSNNSEYQ